MYCQGHKIYHWLSLIFVYTSEVRGVHVVYLVKAFVFCLQLFQTKLITDMLLSVLLEM